MHGVFGEHVFQGQQQQCPPQTTGQGAHAAQDDHHHQHTRLGPVHQIGVDVVLLVDHQCPRQTAQGASQHKQDHLVAVDRKTQCLGAHIVIALGQHHPAKTRMHQAVHEPQAEHQAQQHQVIKSQVIFQVDAKAEIGAHADVQTLVAAIGLDRIDQVIHHLRKGQGDHDEVNAPGAQRNGPDQSGKQGRDQHRGRKTNPAAGHALGDQDAHGVGTDADKCSVAKRHQAAIAQDQVQAASGQAVNHHAAEHGQIKVLALGLHHPAQTHRHCDEQIPSPGGGGAGRRHGAGAHDLRENKPWGRMNKTTAINR